MRATLDLDPELLTAARRRARELGITLRAVVEQGLAAALAHRPAREERFRLSDGRSKARGMPLTPARRFAFKRMLRDQMGTRAL